MRAHFHPGLPVRVTLRMSDWLVSAIGFAVILLLLSVSLSPVWQQGVVALLSYEYALVTSLQDLFGSEWFEMAYPEHELDSLVVFKLSLHQVLWPVAASLSAGIALCVFLRRQDSLTGMLNLHDLDVFISRFYYPSRPVVGRAYEARDPKQDPRAAFALKPIEFALKHKLLLRSSDPIAVTENTLRDPDRPSWTLDQPAAAALFARQLGRPIASTESLLTLPVEYRALLSAMLIDIYANELTLNLSSSALLRQFANSFWNLKALQRRQHDNLPTLSRKNLDMSGVDAVFQSLLAEKQIVALIDRSKFANLLMMRCMAQSALSTSQFLWLKPINRTLFYTLNNVGRTRRLFVEGHAPFAHDEVERQVKQSLTQPQISGSIEALRQSVESQATSLVVNT